MMLPKIIFIIPALFFLTSFLTLNDYGINWDEPIHFNRGQGYLFYFLTGKEVQDKPINNNPSFFHGYNVHDLYDWDGGHPVVSDLLAAFSNFIFFQKLGIVGDINSYHLYNIFTSALTVFLVAIFAFEVYGVFASVIATLALSTYPLFFSESHFNIKDPPETAFFTLAIFAFWKSLRNASWKWFLLSITSAGLAFGTKFNIIFLPFIIFPYLFIRYFYILKKGPQKIFISLYHLNPSYKLLFILSPLIVFAIFFGSWPFLWNDPIPHISKVLFYYKNIATGFDYQPERYTIAGFNFYAPFWVLITTPPLFLFLATVGIIFALLKSDKEQINKLWVLWFAVPILRVMLPNTSIYGGVRQIMEFLPAMALLAGVGASRLVLSLKSQISNFKQFQNLKLKKNWSLEFVCILVLGAWLLAPIIRLHPNENVYFNFLVGGLPGAKEKNIPSWGNSYGNAYWQAIQWINKNAEPNSKLALVQGTGQNVPLIQLRSDIDFSGTNWSGINRSGEYLMELVYQGSQRAYPYVWDYLEKFIDPVYEAKIDGVGIAKVWKNDLEHTKLELRRVEVKYPSLKDAKMESNGFRIDIGKIVELTRIVVPYNDSPLCRKSGTVELSVDGTNWGKEQDDLFTEQVLRFLDKEGGLNFYFPAKSARFIRVTFEDSNSCLPANTEISVYVLE